MNKVIGTLTVYFEKPFWVGVFERIDNGQLSVAKIIFGAEPKDCEILDYVNKHYTKLQFSPALDAVVKETQSQKTATGSKKANTTIGHRHKSATSLKTATRTK